ncbi:hypothetical protein ACQEVC_07760 [Plantactinospora sp. CA-294935]|uniref:hypothetical protein n=1 Tax=Plantactinospora sp. CA-294935 TaxID=3240012 RepID=UPI003D8F181D
MTVPPVHTMSATESLSDLVRRIADRDQAAFSRLYRRLVRSVFLQVCESLGSPADAVPVTRAVFVEVWRLAPVSDARRDDVLVWITGIAARRAGDKLREIDHDSSAVSTDYDGHFDRELAAGFGTEPSTVWSAPPGTRRTGGLRH